MTEMHFIFFCQPWFLSNNIRFICWYLFASSINYIQSSCSIARCPLRFFFFLLLSILRHSLLLINLNIHIFCHSTYPLTPPSHSICTALIFISFIHIFISIQNVSLKVRINILLFFSHSVMLTTKTLCWLYFFLSFFLSLAFSTFLFEWWAFCHSRCRSHHFYTKTFIFWWLWWQW